MVLMRFFIFIFCIFFVTIHAEQQPIIKNTRRTKAIDKAIGSFLGAIFVGTVALGAHACAKEWQKNYTQLSRWEYCFFSSSLQDSIIKAQLICWGTGALSAFLAIEGFYHVFDSIFAQASTQKPDSMERF